MYPVTGRPVTECGLQAEAAAVVVEVVVVVVATTGVIRIRFLKEQSSLQRGDAASAVKLYRRAPRSELG